MACYYATLVLLTCDIMQLKFQSAIYKIKLKIINKTKATSRGPIRYCRPYVSSKSIQAYYFHYLQQ